jgi:ATP-dependent Clp protease ATP-binding subunit ClpA
MRLKAMVPPNLQQLVQDFTGRSQIFNEIDHWLQHKDQRFFILTEEPGVGKSAIAQLKQIILTYPS